MNWLSAWNNFLRSAGPVLAVLGIAACGVSDSESADAGELREYRVHYVLRAEPTAGAVAVELRLEQPASLLRELSFPTDPAITDLSGDGELVVYDDLVRWQPPSGGGVLRWRATVHEQRGDGMYDALLTSDWGIFRMEDVIPRARTRTLKGAVSRTTLAFRLPKGWSAVTEYPGTTQPIAVKRPGRRFDEPAGWVAIGKLGVRRETIAGVHVAVVGPMDHGVRRMDMLALLNWTLPELVSILPDSLPRLTIVSAGEPMWRGGLSGPASFYIHADRPLISENATSALLHETVHTALGIRPARGFDWIAEGLAEFYSIDLLRRGKAITMDREKKAFADQAEWSKRARKLCGGTSEAATTALAVTLFASLDREIKKLTDNTASLDDILPLVADSAVDLDSLTAAVTQVTGATPDTLHIDKLPGCRNMD